MIKALIFDLEGVIIDTEKSVWDKETEVFLQRRGIRYDRTKTKSLMMGSNVKEGIIILKKIYSFEGEIQQLADERLKIIKGLFKNNISFIDGFLEFYKNIHNHYKIAVATSLDRKILDSIESKIKLKSLFNSHIYSIADIGNISKPNPDIFLYAAKKIGVSPNECLVIEDSPKGIEAAIKAKMKCIAITTSTTPNKLRKANFTVNNYRDMIGTLNMLTSN